MSASVPDKTWIVPEGMTVTGAFVGGAQSLFTPKTLAFVLELARLFTPRRDALLAARAVRQKAFDNGALPDFLPETRSVREEDWKVAAIPHDLQDRRVEITGPVERKMIINALNSGAKAFMADFEDSLSPTWDAIVQGQLCLRDAVNRTLRYDGSEGKSYRLNDKTATLIVRPRGWHLNEKHLLADGVEIPGALLDFGLYFITNAEALLARGSGPYFYLPKLEHYTEAGLWRDIFAFAEDRLRLARGTIKATVLIETVTAAFQMDEILHALKDHCVGLNCGRWDYIFSFIKKFHSRADFVLPERAQVTMTTHFLRSYSLLLIKTAHRRGAFAMGGMSAYIPVKGDEAATARAVAMVRADKEREASDGHDGAWVAHPGLIPAAREVFDRLMPGKHQLARLREDISITAADLLSIPQGTITEAGLRNNISVSLRYLSAWLAGNGCVPIHHLMEDAATAEIARAQLWQWVHHRARLADGRTITAEIFRQALAEESDGAPGIAGGLLEQWVLQQEFLEFLTLPGYRLLA